MDALSITTCPRCGAELDAFHHTDWQTMELRTGAGPVICPACRQPLDPKRAAWQEAAGSGALRSEAIRWLEVTAAGVVTVAIVCFTVSFYTSGYSLYGMVALVLLVGFALVLAWRCASRPAKEPPLVQFELLPHTGPPSATPLWDTRLTEGIRATVPPPREKRCEPDRAIPAPSPRKSLTLSSDEIAHRIAIAWLEPEVDHPIRRQVRVLSEQTVQWRAMRPADADGRFGTPMVVGRDGTRAYVALRRDGRGTLSLLQRDGTERVLRMEVKWRKRRA